MVHRLLRALTFANVCSFLALTIALGTGTAYAANTVFSTDIVNGEVKTPDIGLDQVTGSRIAPGAVFGTDLHGDAVTSAKVKDGSLVGADLAAETVDGSKLADATVTSADLGFNSVASGEIANDAVNGSEVAANAIDSDEILDNSLTLFDLGTGSVRSPEIEDGAVSSADLASSSVDSAKIANDSVTHSDLAGGASNGSITLNAGFVATGRCRDVGISVPGADTGDAIIFSVNSDLPDGILVAGVRGIDDDVIQGKVCNFTGGVFPQLNNIQVAIVTFRI